MFIEVSTMAEIRAAHRMSLVSRSAEETVTSSSGDGVGSVRMSPGSDVLH